MFSGIRLNNPIVEIVAVCDVYDAPVLSRRFIKKV